MGRQKVIADLKDAVSLVQDGMTIALGGVFTVNRPTAMVREIVRKRVRGLTVVDISAGLNLEFLIAGGCVEKVITAYAGGEGMVAVAPMFRKSVEEGVLRVWEADAGIVVTALRAASLNLPFLPKRGGLGTSIPEVNPDLKIFSDPVKGERLLAVPAIRPDLAILHAQYSDEYGNTVYRGSGFVDSLIARAAKKVVVQVEELIPNREVRCSPQSTAISCMLVDCVVKAPFGAHPFSSEGFYRLDRQFFSEYFQAAEEYKKGSRDSLQGFLDKYFYNPADWFGYLEKVGIRRLFELKEYWRESDSHGYKA